MNSIRNNNLFLVLVFVVVCLFHNAENHVKGNEKLHEDLEKMWSYVNTIKNGYLVNGTVNILGYLDNAKVQELNNKLVNTFSEYYGHLEKQAKTTGSLGSLYIEHQFFKTFFDAHNEVVEIIKQIIAKTSDEATKEKKISDLKKVVLELRKCGDYVLKEYKNRPSDLKNIPTYPAFKETLYTLPEYQNYCA